MLKRLSYHPFFIKLLHWEYWPFHVVYGLLYPVFLWYCLKARSFFFYAAANPSIENGGFLMESKKKVYDLIPDNYKPLTLYYESGTALQIVCDEIKEHQFQYPLIVKPDIGCKGQGVVKVDNEAALSHAIQKFNCALLVQPFIPYQKEMGLFYVRYPNQSKGFISGIVEKEFVKVVGDGTSTVHELLLQNKRYVLQMKALQQLCAEQMNIIPKKNEELLLLPFGNHARGSLFLDASSDINQPLTDAINNMCLQVDGFYYGRLDIKYESLELLQQGQHFCIIELNGAGSEPTHIYDPKHSIFFAWKEIIRHWKMLYEISMLNKKKGAPFLKFSEGKKMFKQDAEHQAKLALL
jgi:hypothetical protein